MSNATPMIPTWDQPAFIVEIKPEHFDPEGGCHYQGATCPAEYLSTEVLLQFSGQSPEGFTNWLHNVSWRTTHIEAEATRFPTRDAAELALNQYMPDGPCMGDPDDWPHNGFEPQVRRFEPIYRNRSGGPAVFVNVYAVGRAYGGPEDQGWYFDAGSPVCSVIVETEDEAEEMRERLRPEFPDTGRSSSVLGGEDYRIAIEWEPGKEFPTEHPHYC